jgi:hypothetical protein
MRRIKSKEPRVRSIWSAITLVKKVYPCLVASDVEVIGHPAFSFETELGKVVSAVIAKEQGPPWLEHLFSPTVSKKGGSFCGCGIETPKTDLPDILDRHSPLVGVESTEDKDHDGNVYGSIRYRGWRSTWRREVPDFSQTMLFGIIGILLLVTCFQTKINK